MPCHSTEYECPCEHDGSRGHLPDDGLPDAMVALTEVCEPPAKRWLLVNRERQKKKGNRLISGSTCAKQRSGQMYVESNA